MSDTKYTVALLDGDDVTELKVLSRKDPAVDFAGEYHLEHPETHVVVTTAAGTVVADLEPMLHAGDVTEAPTPEAAEGEVDALVKAGASEEVVAEAIRRTKPWSRIDEAKTFEAPEVDGYTLAYTRERTKTAIYRADDKSNWMVLDTRDGSKHVVENTTEARMITNRMQAEYRVEVEKAKAAAKLAKAEKTAADKKAKDVVKKEKEAEKAKAKADKEAAKADKEAAKDEESVDA